MIAILAAASSFAAASAAELRVGGTGNALGTVVLLGHAFTKLNPDIKLTMLQSIGTAGAIKAVPKGALDIGLSSRALTTDEGKSGMVALEYARTPLVFAVSTKSKVSALSLDDIADIYRGKLATWPDNSQVRLVLRQAGEDNMRQVRLMSPAIDAALSVVEKSPGMPFAMTDQETADKIASIPGALGVTTLSLITSENRPLRALTLNGVEPTASNGASGRYAFAKRFFFITRADPSADVARFIAYVQSPAGREILTRVGHWIP